MMGVTALGVTKRFGETLVLGGVDLRVGPGEFAVLVGPSGCGKSTLLRILAGLELPDDGRVVIGERDVTSAPPRDRDVAMVFQSYALYPHLTVEDNLGFALKLRREAASEIARRVSEVSELLGLGQLLQRYPRELSGGQRQRVAMGRAIVRRPTLFLFDEPLSNLDATLRGQVRVEIRRLHEQLGVTSVYVTHDQVEAMTMADRIFVMRQGRIEQSGPPLEVFAQPKTRFVAEFLGSPAMNFFPAMVARSPSGTVLELGEGLRVEAPTHLRSEVATGAPVTIGIRAHDLQQVSEGGVTFTLDHTEELGAEALWHGRIAGHPCVVRGPAAAGHARGATLMVRAQHVHVFSPADGASLLTFT